MHEWLWLATGAAGASAVAWLLHRRRPRLIPPPAAAAPPPQAPAPEPPPPATTASLGPQALATAVADQLAGLASGIVGNAQLLIEAGSRGSAPPPAAEQLWAAVQRLQRLHSKLRAFAAPPEPDTGATSVATTLSALRDELQLLHFGLQVEIEGPAVLPPVRIGPATLHDALVCLASALMHMERGARRLVLGTQAHFEGVEPEVAIALDLEWVDEPVTELQGHPRAQSLELDCTAARNLLASQGATVEVWHLADQHVARALVLLPAVPGAFAAAHDDDWELGSAAASPLCAPAEPPMPVEEDWNDPGPRPPRGRDRYGGVLVLEQDPAIRSLLSAELEARGRSVFACTDGEAARSLLAATPDRFELLIVDQRTRPESGDQLAESVARLCPGLQVCVLQTEPPTGVPGEDVRGRLHRLSKPFGVRELRVLLAALLPG